MKYSFVFLLQGKQNSRKGVMLTELRLIRLDLKKKIKELGKKEKKDESDLSALAFMDSKQQSIKILMNSEYG